MKLGKYKWVFENWEIFGVVIAGLIVLILHELGVIHEDTVLISMILFLLCLYVIRDMSFETANEAQNKNIFEKLKSIESRLEESEIELVTPKNIVYAVNEFYSKNKGEIWLFNMCMRMYGKKDLFDRVLKPVIDNENATEIQFIVHTSEKEIWETDVTVLISKCKNKNKVLPPIFAEIKEPIAFQMIRTETQRDEREALLSVWGEPFMAGHGKENSAKTAHHPRYVFYIKSHSEVIPRLKELFMSYKLTQ